MLLSKGSTKLAELLKKVLSFIKLEPLPDKFLVYMGVIVSRCAEGGLAFVGPWDAMGFTRPQPPSSAQCGEAHCCSVSPASLPHAALRQVTVAVNEWD
jgi:hypothetical protein